MPARGNILGQRFYYRDLSKPPWHGIGDGDETPHTAVQGITRIGFFGVEKQPMKVMINGQLVDSKWFALVRDPIKEDPDYRIIGTPVSEDFEVITPYRTAELADANVLDGQGNPVPIETCGILGKGERTFFCWRLPTFDVRGDEVSNYMILDSPLENNISIGVYTTPVRVVCQNTLVSGIAAASQKLQMVTHNKGASDQLGRWLGTVYGNALAASELIQEAYQVLANKPVTIPEIKWIVENTYPMPPRPEIETPSARLSYETRMEMWQANCTRTERIRKTVLDLVDGAGTGMDTRAAAGTAWGAWMGITEAETYRKGALGIAIGSLIGGQRSQRIIRGFRLAQVADRHETVSIADLDLPFVYA